MKTISLTFKDDAIADAFVRNTQIVCGGFLTEFTDKTRATRGNLVIEYNSYGQVLDKGISSIIFQLLGHSALTGAERELLRDLTGGYIQWKEVPAP